MLIDIGFLIFLLYGFYLGYSRGILKTIYAILSIVLAIIISLKFSPFLIDILNDSLKLGSTISLIIGFIFIFLTVVFLVRIFGKGVEKLFKTVKLNFINKIVGGVMMAMLFVVSYSAILWFLNQTNTLSETQKEKSFTYEQLEPIPEQARGAISSLKPAFKGFWEKSREAFDESKQETKTIENESTPE